MILTCELESGNEGHTHLIAKISIELQCRNYDLVMTAIKIESLANINYQRAIKNAHKSKKRSII